VSVVLFFAYMYNTTVKYRTCQRVDHHHYDQWTAMSLITTNSLTAATTMITDG